MVRTLKTSHTLYKITFITSLSRKHYILLPLANLCVSQCSYVNNGPQEKSGFSLSQYMSVFSTFIYLFGVLRHFQHCTGHITTGSWKGRGNQYIEFARVVYCKLPTNGKQLPAFPLKAITGIKPRPQRWEARVLPLYHRGPCVFSTVHTCLYFRIIEFKSIFYQNECIRCMSEGRKNRPFLIFEHQHIFA